MLALLRRSRALQVILVVVIAANLASGGMGDVALPALAHAKYGAGGYGALLACLAVGGIAGTLGAARTGGLRAPAMFASAVFLAESVCIALVPYLGGEAGAAVFLCLSGVCNGLGNVIFLTVMQKWVPPGQSRAGDGNADALRVRQLPAVGGGVGRAGPPSRAGAVLPGWPARWSRVAMLFGLTQREFRTFGATGNGGDPVDVAQAADDSQAAEGSRK